MNERETNSNGARIERRFVGPYADRYQYDSKHCPAADGWRQYDTDQDAWYFGIWIHLERREIVTYAEGDETRVHCPTKEVFNAEIASMNDCYKPAPAFKTIDIETGVVTHVYDKDALFGREVPVNG